MVFVRNSTIRSANVTENLECGGAEDKLMARESATAILHSLKNTIQELKELLKC